MASATSAAEEKCESTRTEAMVVRRSCVGRERGGGGILGVELDQKTSVVNIPNIGFCPKVRQEC